MIQSAKLAIRKDSLLLIFLVLPFFMSNQIIKILNLNSLLTVWRLFSFTYIIAAYVHIKKLPSKLTMLLLGLWNILMISSILSENSVYAAFMKILTLFTFIFIVDYFLHKSVIGCLNGLLIIFEFLIYLNLLCIILFPKSFNGGGHEKIWLLDNYAAQLKWFLPGLCTSFAYSRFAKNKARFYRLFIAIILSSVLSGSATLAATTFLLVLLWNYVRKGKINIKIKHGIVISLVFLVCVVVLRMQNYFAFIIERLLHRNLSFTGRTAIWNSSLYMFKNRPIIGYGYWVYPRMTDWAADLYTSINGEAVASHAHCQYLHFLIQGGIIFLICFVLLNLWISKLFSSRNNSIMRFTSLIVFLIMFAGLVETMYDSPLVFLPYIIGYFSFQNMPLYENINE